MPWKKLKSNMNLQARSEWKEGKQLVKEASRNPEMGLMQKQFVCLYKQFLLKVHCVGTSTN